MDVEVHRLKAPLRLANARIFGGRSASNYRVPAGAYWIPMDQPQKHWIQATLGEDPYVPFPYFYDVSSWSNPLLMGVPTVYTGDRVRPSAERVRGLEGGVRARRPPHPLLRVRARLLAGRGADVPPARPRRHAAP